MKDTLLVFGIFGAILLFVGLGIAFEVAKFVAVWRFAFG